MWTVISPNGRYAKVGVQRWPLVLAYLSLGWTLETTGEGFEMTPDGARLRRSWLEVCDRITRLGLSELEGVSYERYLQWRLALGVDVPVIAESPAERKE